MNNAEQIGKMLEGLGFVPYHMNQYFQKEGFGQHWQKWSKDHVEVFRKSSDQWEVMKEGDMGWSDIYTGPATHFLIREILEVNGLVEANPKSFREDLADFMEKWGAVIEVNEDTEYGFHMDISTSDYSEYFLQITYVNDKTITPEMLRGKAEEK